MKRFSRIEELAMRNTMHTVEWTGDITIKHKDINKENIDKYFYFDYFPNSLMAIMFEFGFFTVDCISASELIDAQKERLKEILINEDKENKEFGINFNVDIRCTLDGDEIDFDILSDGSKEYILDMILFEKMKEGTFVEIFPEPVEDDEAYPFTYLAHNGYED